METRLFTPSPHTGAVTISTVGHGSPVDTRVPRVRLDTAEFSRSPHDAYAAMRRDFGAMVPVLLAPDVPATLVIDYRTAVRILHDPDPQHFSADPREWQKTIPEDHPLRPMMEWQPAARFCTGVEHKRYRDPSTDALRSVDLHALHATVQEIAVPLIDSCVEICARDNSVDVLAHYAFPLVLGVLNRLCGCPPELGRRVAVGTAERFDGESHARRGMDRTTRALQDLVELKRQQPGNDLASWLAHHPNELSEQEVLAQLISFYGAGLEAQRNLISNTLLVLLTVGNERFAGGLLSGSLSTRDALDEVLFTDPPMANFCIRYPRQPTLVGNTWLPAHQPVVISMAACSSDPAIAGIDRTGNRSHLAWGAGPHACPATKVAYLVAQDAIDELLDQLPEMALAVPAAELAWRPGPFHRALTALPVVFPPTGTGAGRRPGRAELNQ